MAGYHGYSMSNNAIAAYENGLVPASKIKGVPAKLVKEFCSPAEWHHTSKNYNRTDFFDPEYVRATFGLEESEDYEVNPKATAALKAHKTEAPKVTIHEDCRVEWLEWSGPKSRPRCEEMVVEGLRVEVKGQTATVIFTNGVMKKRLGTNGFSFIPEYTKYRKEQDRLDKIRAKERVKADREHNRDCKARGRKLPKSLSKLAGDAEKVWAAISSNGTRVLDVKLMDFEKEGLNTKASWFGEYRDECRSALAEKGVVMSGVVIDIKGTLYFVAKGNFESFAEAFAFAQ